MVMKLIASMEKTFLATTGKVKMAQTASAKLISGGGST